jgi:hypothetical protein
MSLSTYGLEALGIDDAEAFNDGFTKKFLHSSLGHTKVRHRLYLMEEAMEKMHRAIAHDGQKGVCLSITSTRLCIDGEEVDRKPLEEMIAYLTEHSRYSFRFVDLPEGEKALYFSGWK